MLYPPSQPLSDFGIVYLRGLFEQILDERYAVETAKVKQYLGTTRVRIPKE